MVSKPAADSQFLPCLPRCPAFSRVRELTPVRNENSPRTCEGCFENRVERRNPHRVPPDNSSLINIGPRTWQEPGEREPGPGEPGRPSREPGGKEPERPCWEPGEPGLPWPEPEERGPGPERPCWGLGGKEPERPCWEPGGKEPEPPCWGPGEPGPERLC